jgi:hypothetical protein
MLDSAFRVFADALEKAFTPPDHRSKLQLDLAQSAHVNRCPVTKDSVLEQILARRASFWDLFFEGLELSGRIGTGVTIWPSADQKRLIQFKTFSYLPEPGKIGPRGGDRVLSCVPSRLSSSTVLSGAARSLVAGGCMARTLPALRVRP